MEQTFIGVTEHNMQKRNNLMNEIAFDKVLRALERGKQCMVFVHSRKDTGKTARAIQELAGKRGKTSLFSPYIVDKKKGGGKDKDGDVISSKIRSEFAHLQNGVKVWQC